MKFSYNWLKDLTKMNIMPEKLAELLTFHSFEVESIEPFLNSLNKIVVGRILEIKKHPNADKLQLAKVNIGKKILNIVCGAPNIKEGQIVPVAFVGAVIQKTEIKETEIRGIKSEAMMCSEYELGLGDDHTGIMILPDNFKIGRALKDEIKSDYILNIDILPNRQSDCLSHWGLAKEILAVLGKEGNISLETKFIEDKKIKIQNLISVEVQDKLICPRYMAGVMTNIKIEPSPIWLKLRLIAAGLKPINNIVDITNYVMFETGQPLHAFDFDKISDATNLKSKVENLKLKKIIIRSAKQGEKIFALDGNNYNLNIGDVVITDNKGIIALGGIIGGGDSEISSSTKTIVLESANFNYLNIRNTSKRLNLTTEAALRFGAGLDPNLAELGLKRAMHLIRKIAGARAVSGIIDVYPKKSQPKKINFDLKRANSILGIEISKKDVLKIFKNLGFKAKESKKLINVEIPTIRRDVNLFNDLVEEVGRIYGYEKIKPSAPYGYFPAPAENEEFNFEKLIKNLFVQAGYSEIQNYSFVSEKDLELFEYPKDKAIKLLNPVSEEYAYLQPTIVINLIKSVGKNLKNFLSLKNFEIGKVFNIDNEYKEYKEIVAIVAGKKFSEKNKGFYEIKGLAEFLLSSIGLNDFRFIEYEKDSHILAIIESGKEKIGSISEINFKILENYKINSRIFVLKFDYDKLKQLIVLDREYHELPKYPAIERDISILANYNTKVEQLQNIIELTAGNLLKDSDLIDIYEPENFEEKVSYTFRLIFRSNEKTLTSEEVDNLMVKIINALKEAKFEIK